MYVKVKDLPQAIQNGLRKVGYGKPDINIEVKPTVSICNSGGDGYRGFYCLVNLTTSECSEAHHGSWGGPNPFEARRVDVDDTNYTIAKDFAVLRGTEGGSRPVMCTVFISPDNVVPNLLPQAPVMTDRDKQILGAVNSYTSVYRKEYLARMAVSTAELDKLVTDGFLKRNKAGSISITTEGKNCAGKVY